MSVRDAGDRNYDFSEIELDPRFERCEYEMKLSFGSWIVYALTSIGLSYYLSLGEITFTYGMPSWFFWGECVTTSVFFIFVCIVSRAVFRDMDLTD